MCTLVEDCLIIYKGEKDNFIDIKCNNAIIDSVLSN